MIVSLRIAAAFAVVVPVLGPARIARAELPNGAELTFDMLRIREDGGSLQEPSTDRALQFYLNQAHCVCSKAAAGMEQTLSYQVKLSVDTNSNRPVEFYVGTSCDMDDLRPTMCRSIGTIGDIDTLVTSPQTFEFSLFDVINGVAVDEPCRPADNGTATLWALVDIDANTMPEHAQPVPIENASGTVKGFDTAPPPLPTEFEGSPAEGGIRLNWTIPTTQVDIRGYQAFCWKAADGTPAKSASLSPLYQTATDVCGLPAEVGLTATDLVVSGTQTDGGTGGTTTPPAGVLALDPAYLCHEEENKTLSEMVIRGLDNNVEYGVAVVVVDDFGNVAGVTFNQTITPKSVIDFWEDLHDRGSGVEGGFCLTGNVGRGTAGGVGAIVLAFALVVRRRRKLARGALLALPFAVLALAPRPALAQEPYWADGQTDNALAIEEEDQVNWHVGLRFGPFTPGIDEQLGMSPGPYEQMFGGSRVLPMLDVDRIIWRGSGQLGLGGSIGYMQKTAKAFAEGTAPGEDRMRSPGDENTFRLIPINATAVYRATQLDDLYGIPVVPYVRAGLGYYIWSFRTNGETSEACWDGTHTQDCDADKGYGGTLGMVLSAGLAIRAERIDADTALSMRTSGIEHAGFYAEIQMAKIDGFGVEQKLSVGDTTWFIGADFEF